MSLAPRTLQLARVGVLAVFGLALLLGSAQAAEKRIALVIGNARYPAAPLNNPENDARVVASTLRRLGFEVDERVNLSIKAFRQVLRDYGRRLQAEDGASVFYYAGHGVQIAGRNYLLPVDVDLRDEEEIRDEAIDVDELFVSRLERARTPVRIVILDACRDNPFAGKAAAVPTRSTRAVDAGRAGLAEMAARGTLIAFSSAPGATAEDGPPGSNSVYTRNLVKEMLVEGVEVEQMFKSVRIKVLQETDQRQIPWVNTSLVADFSFNPRRGAAPGDQALRDELERLRAALTQREREQQRIEAELRALRAQGASATARPGVGLPASQVPADQPVATSGSGSAAGPIDGATAAGSGRPSGTAPARPGGGASERCVALQIRAQLNELTPRELAQLQRECR